ncbi:MFS transporter [Candidatus Woesearchaeota archaeon]|nr:MFS transporter [Candidatus Woesearchaeota archaeon]
MHKQMKLFLVANSFFIMSLGMYGPIHAIFVQEIGGNILAAGSAWAIFMITSGIGILFMGKLVDAIQREKPLMMLGYAISSLGFLGYYFVSNVYHLFGVQVLLGLGYVMINPAGNSFYTKYLEKGKIASQWSAWEGSYFTLTGVAAIVGAFLVKIFNFKTLFLVMFILSLIGLFVASQLRDKNER